jgi:IS30 family transposase
VLRKYIIEKLNKDWSPEEISGRLKLMHNDPERDDYIPSVCHESIYTYIYHPDRKKEKLYLLLRRHKPVRIKHGTRKKQSVDTIIKERTPISQREKIIEKKTRI